MPTLMMTGMLSRVALEYGQIWWAACASSSAVAWSTPPRTGLKTAERENSPSSPWVRVISAVMVVLVTNLAGGRGAARGAEEAGGPAGGEELLGVGRGARAAELLGEGEAGLQQTVGGADMTAVPALSVDVDNGGVADCHDWCSPSGPKGPWSPADQDTLCVTG